MIGKWDLIVQWFRNRRPFQFPLGFSMACVIALA